MGTSRNRNAGNGYELKILTRLKHLFPNILTSRNESRSKDAQKIDFCNTSPYQFQCKLTMNTPNVSILDEMPEGKNVIIWGKVKKANKNFILKDEYAILKLKDLIELITKNCTCSEEETTGSTTFECCNICGKILTQNKSKDEETNA